MRYEFICTKCSKTVEIGSTMKDYDWNKAHMRCCQQQMEPVIYGGLGVAFMREGFPKGYEITEHCTDEPVYCRDKSHLKDLCEQSGTVSRYLEDDV